MQEKKPRPDPQIRLNGQSLKVKNTHKILGITFENRLTWKAHITEAKSAKRINLLRSLTGTNWGADQGMLLWIHEMFILSALENGSTAYGSATDGQLKRLEPIHNRRLRIALGAFCVCKTTNVLCESGYGNLDERRKRKLTSIALHVAENENHPVNKLLTDQEVYDEYALRRKQSKPEYGRVCERTWTPTLDQQQLWQYDHPTYGFAKRVRIGQNPSWIGYDNRGGRTSGICWSLHGRLCYGWAVRMCNCDGPEGVKITLAGQMSIFNILSVTLWPKKRLSPEEIARKWYYKT
jgi:hypothetical protein